VNRLIALSICTVGCVAPPSQSQEAPRGIGSAIAASTYRMSSEKQAIRSFKPHKEAVLEGGECSFDTVPIDPGRRLTAHFPTRTESETVLILIVDPSGAPLRYIEVRGLPRPRYIWDVEEHFARTESTYIQFDYPTNTAFAGNSMPDESSVGVRGTIDDFVEAEIVQDLPGRFELVKRLCFAVP
jgi:hypothetical protein